MHIGDKRRALINFAFANNRAITKQQAVDLIGRTYYCNGDKHTGDILSRLVNAGIFIRIKPGHFKLADALPKKQQASYPTNHPKLF